jgi:hypothetical protein
MDMRKLEAEKLEIFVDLFNATSDTEFDVLLRVAIMMKRRGTTKTRGGTSNHCLGDKSIKLKKIKKKKILREFLKCFGKT